MRNPLRFLRGAPEQPTIRERLAAGKVRLAHLTRRPEATTDAGRRTMMGGALAAAVPLPARAAPSDLARACDWAMAHVAWINGTCHPEQWDDTRVTAELARYDAAFRRAVDEPSTSLADLKAKARLLLSDLVENGAPPGSDATPTDDERLTRVVLAEIIAL